MKALRYHARGDLRLDDVAEPQVRPGTVKLDVAWSGICGSELHEYEEGPIMVPADAANPVTGERTPVIMGHEFAGTVSAIGEGISHVRVGDAVAVEPLIYCQDCLACRAGAYHLCPHLAIIGIHGVAGGFAKHAVVPGYTVHRLPPAMSTELGALVEPLAVSWHGMQLAGFRAGNTALVMGAGPIGLSSLLCAQAAGAMFVAVAVRRAGARKQAAQRLNADAILDSNECDVAEAILELTGGRGVDVVFETAGTQAAMDTAMAAVRTGGTIVSLAVWPTEGRCDYMRLLLKEVRLVGSMCYNNAFPAVIKAVAEDRIRNASQMITKRVSLDEAIIEGFDVLVQDKGQHVKVLVKP